MGAVPYAAVVRYDCFGVVDGLVGAGVDAAVGVEAAGGVRREGVAAVVSSRRDLRGIELWLRLAKSWRMWERGHGTGDLLFVAAKYGSCIEFVKIYAWLDWDCHTSFGSNIYRPVYW